MFSILRYISLVLFTLPSMNEMPHHMTIL